MLDKEIKKLVEAELKEATAKYGEFKSRHEAYAVLLEEVQEAEDNMSYIKDNLSTLWDDVKRDVNNVHIKDCLEILEENSIDQIKESIQVAAMIKKFQVFIKK